MEQMSANLLGRCLISMNAFSQRQILLLDPQVHEVSDYSCHKESEVATQGLSPQIMWE